MKEGTFKYFADLGKVSPCKNMYTKLFTILFTIGLSQKTKTKNSEKSAKKTTEKKKIFYPVVI